MGSKPGKVRKQMRSTLSAGYPWGKLELSAAGGLWDTVWNPAQHCPPKGGGMFSSACTCHQLGLLPGAPTHGTLGLPPKTESLGGVQALLEGHHTVC